MPNSTSDRSVNEAVARSGAMYGSSARTSSIAPPSPSRALVARVKDARIEPRRLAVLKLRRRALEPLPKLLERFDQLLAPPADLRIDVREHALLRNALERDRAAWRQGRESRLDLRLDGGRWVGEHRSEPIGEAELAPVLTDEIKHCEALLVRPRAKSKTAPELLHEDREAVGRTHKQHGVDLRNVDALVE